MRGNEQRGGESEEGTGRDEERLQRTKNRTSLKTHMEEKTIRLPFLANK